MDMYPRSLQEAIDDINAYVYDNINNGVYQTGFASSQRAYEKHYDQLFEALQAIEARLARQRYLTGPQITEADWRLFTTLVRFDAVYYVHFKCNGRRIVDYPNLYEYLLELYQWPGIARTVYFDHIKHHYYASHETLNPSGIVPKGPEQDLTRPHRRQD
jgi:putative glutathione S-transferase